MAAVSAVLFVVAVTIFGLQIFVSAAPSVVSRGGFPKDIVEAELELDKLEEQLVKLEKELQEIENDTSIDLFSNLRFSPEEIEGLANESVAQVITFGEAHLRELKAFLAANAPDSWVAPVEDLTIDSLRCFVRENMRLYYHWMQANITGTKKLPRMQEFAGAKIDPKVLIHQLNAKCDKLGDKVLKLANAMSATFSAFPPRVKAMANKHFSYVDKFLSKRELAKLEAAPAVIEFLELLKETSVFERQQMADQFPKIRKLFSYPYFDVILQSFIDLVKASIANLVLPELLKAVLNDPSKITATTAYPKATLDLIQKAMSP